MTKFMTIAEIARDKSLLALAVLNGAMILAALVLTVYWWTTWQ